MGLVIGVGGTKPLFPFDYYYGIEFDTSVSNPTCVRVGRADLHKALPLQNMMQRCILKDDGSVNYYLNANDSTKRDNGSDADLTGADGMYMVELPDMYVRFEMDGTKRRVLMSTEALPGFVHWGKNYVSAVEATVERSTSKLAAVVNNTAAYRGGDNQADWDDTSKSQLGMPATNISLTNFRAYARKRGSASWNCNIYAIQKKLYWLFAVEYATLNSQAAFSAELTSEGYRQGGLGAGVTTLNSSKWSAFNSNYPVVPCGTTNSLGNKSGVVDFVMPSEYDASNVTVKVPSYRGVENPFGHIWKWTDGCKVIIQSDADGGTSNFYACDLPESFTSSGVANYFKRGQLPRANGYVKETCFGQFGEILPLLCGASDTTYYCDYFYTSIPTSGTAERGVLFGGSSSAGTSAGFVSAYTYHTASSAYASFGSRLCFEP